MYVYLWFLPMFTNRLVFPFLRHTQFNFQAITWNMHVSAKVKWGECLPKHVQYSRKQYILITKSPSFRYTQHWPESRKITVWMRYFQVKTMAFYLLRDCVSFCLSLYGHQRVGSDTDIAWHRFLCEFSIFKGALPHAAQSVWSSKLLKYAVPCAFAVNVSTSVKI